MIAQAKDLTNLLKNSPLVIDDVEYPILIIWGSYEILAQADPAQMILTASENVRNQSV